MKVSDKFQLKIEDSSRNESYVNGGRLSTEDTATRILLVILITVFFVRCSFN